MMLYTYQLPAVSSPSYTAVCPYLHMVGLLFSDLAYNPASAEAEPFHGVNPMNA